MKNKTIYIIFAILLLIYASITFLKKDNTSNFKEEKLKIEKNEIDKIEINPKDKSKQKFFLLKENNNWQINVEDKKYPADTNFVSSLLSVFSNLKIDDVVSTNKEKFAKYELENDKSKEIEFFTNSKSVANLLIGKLNFNQQMRSAKSYFRIKNKNKVYATNGFLSINVSEDFNTFRNKDLANFEVKNVTSFTINNKNYTKQNNSWSINNQPADSTKIYNYLTKISKIKGAQFDNTNKNWQKETSIRSFSLHLNNGKNISINVFQDSTSNGYILNSNLNPNAYFKSDSAGVYKQIFTNSL